MFTTKCLAIPLHGMDTRKIWMRSDFSIQFVVDVKCKTEKYVTHETVFG